MTSSEQTQADPIIAGGAAVPIDETCPAPATAAAASDRDTIRIPLHVEELRAVVRPDTSAPVRVQRRIVRESPESEIVAGAEDIRVSRQFVTRPGADGESVPYEQIVVELPLPAGMTPAALETDGAAQIIVTHEIVQRTVRVAGTVRREDVRVVAGDTETV